MSTSDLGASNLRLAHESEFANVFPDCEVGAIPPFGNHYGIAVYVDKHLTEDESIVFPIGTHTDTYHCFSTITSYHSFFTPYISAEYRVQ